MSGLEKKVYESTGSLCEREDKQVKIDRILITLFPLIKSDKNQNSFDNGINFLKMDICALTNIRI
jgi:hypothetical protein